MTDRAAAITRHLTVTGIILRAGKVLLLDHNAYDGWLCPGGHVEPNEDPEQALRREVTEEVGLQVDVINEPRPTPPGVTVVAAPWTIHVEDIPDHPSGRPHQHIDCFYVCTPSQDQSQLSGEYDGRARWVPIGDVAALSTPPELPSLIEAAASWATRCGADVGIVPHVAWLASLPGHPAGAAILFRDPSDRVLLVQPVYRLDRWQVPGGTLDEGEAPAETARREVHEELGLTIDGDLRLLSVDWVRTPGTPSIIQFTFDGGVLEPVEAERSIVLADGELAAWTFAGPDQWPELLSEWTVRRVRAAVAAATAGATVYLHDGWPIDDATAALIGPTEAPEARR